jgi:hypothetical protein
MKLIIGEKHPNHAGDTSRELFSMWEESELCDTERNDSTHHCWLNEIGNILLYEYPRLDSHPGIPDKWEYGLFGNTQYQSPKSKSWIFWARRPRLMEQTITKGLPKYNDRHIESIFLGKIENSIQYGNRSDKSWDMHIEKFSMPIHAGGTSKWPYTQQEYLDLLSQSKFGLCLAGFGPKCNREVEYLGLGVVPIVTPNVDLSYYNPLKEGEHYIKVSQPRDIPEVINSISKSQWEDMSAAGQQWYNINCSRVGSFETTMEIISDWL